MRDVIEKVMEAEREAQRRLEAARAEAAGLLADAQREAHELVTRSGEEARAEAEKLVNAAKGDAQREKKEQLARAGAEIEAGVRLDEETHRRAVSAVVRNVCGNH